MSSYEAEDAQLPSSPPFQSAQHTSEYYDGGGDLDLKAGSDDLSDKSYSKGQGPQTSHRESSLVDDSVARHLGAEDDLDDNTRDSTTSPLRPNKFRGPPSTWRNRTATERDLAASLDQLQAKDLSVHLYNSFKLKQRDRNREPGWQGRASKTSGEKDPGPKWTLPKVWTAWPLPPDIVPREHDEQRWVDDVFPSVQHHSIPRRPGQFLQDMLVAQFLRIAKERFHERQWGVAPESEATSTAQGEQSESFGKDLNATFGAEQDVENPGQKPFVMADDQRASEILQPTVQHMMTRLDDLLMGLHHARNTYLPAEDSGSEAHGQTIKRSTSRGRHQTKKQAQRDTEEGVEAGHDALDDTSSDSDDYNPRRKKSGSRRRTQHQKSSLRRSRSQKFHDRKGRLGLRDWSDVLGIASMIGWHQNVVSSTTARCATIFEEGIKFRTLHEGKKDREELVYLPNAPTHASSEQSQSDVREGLSNRSRSPKVGGVHVDGFLEPIEGKKSWMYRNSKHSLRKRSSRTLRA